MIKYLLLCSLSFLVSKANSYAYTPDKLLITWVKNPANEATISFEPMNGQERNLVVFDTISHKDSLDPDHDYKFQLVATDTNLEDQCRFYSNNKFRYVRVHLTGLEPDTTYFFRTLSAGKPSEEMHFITGPRRSTSYKLLSGGDSRSDRNQRIMMNRQVKKLMEENPSYRALIHGGDYVMTGKSCSNWRGWLDDHQETITANNRVLPIIPTFGNHESGGEKIYRRIFSHPEIASSFYYHIRLGMLDLVILNSEVSTEGKQKQFLYNTLKKLKDRSSFKIVGYHRPAFPAVKKPATTKTFVPILEEFRVQLVLESDGHALKQTCPIRNEKCRPGGVIYVGEGGLGVPQRTPGKSDKWYFGSGGYALSQHHIQSIELDVQQEEVTYRVYFNDDFHYPLSFAIKD